MKKLLTVSVLFLLGYTIVHAQIQTPTRITKFKTINTTQAPVYTLTNARVSIITGRDNKEFPSFVQVWLYHKRKGVLYASPEIRNEMQVNSPFEFGLTKWSNTVNMGSFLLSDIQRTGIKLTIGYWPNLFTDAWRIEGISLTLEFRDQYNNLHPTLGNKTIVFNNANGFLNKWERYFECTADGNFNSVISLIVQQTTDWN
jgi:hypothetical protein